MQASDTVSLEDRVLDIVREVLAIDDGDVTLDSTIREDLAADSLDQLSLFMALEDEFGGSIGEEEAARLETLRDVVHHIREHSTAVAGE